MTEMIYSEKQMFDNGALRYSVFNYIYLVTRFSQLVQEYSVICGDKTVVKISS